MVVEISPNGVVGLSHQPPPAAYLRESGCANIPYWHAPARLTKLAKFFEILYTTTCHAN